MKATKTEKQKRLDLILDRRIFELEAVEFDEIANNLDAPAKENIVLHKLMQLKPRWQ